MLREVIDVLAPVEGGTYIDATVGLGGHSEEILKMIGQDGRVVGIDRDDAALSRSGERISDSRLILKKASFSELGSVLDSCGISGVDGILFDLGVSMMQLKDLGRGFSFNSTERLDMRMDSSQSTTAWDIVNRYHEADLIRVLRDYGEEYRAKRIVRFISEHRAGKSIDTCAELADIVQRAVGRSGRVHPATRVFQAIRIEVNREIEELAAGLESAVRVLRQGGRLCVISYHSLEDRLVKNFVRENAKKNVLRPLSKKPLIPGPAEIKENPSSRSAKMRGAEKL